MFVNLEDHSDHNPAECSYARILYVKNLLNSSAEGQDHLIEQLSTLDMFRIGFMISQESMFYEFYEVTMDDAILMSEKLRMTFHGRFGGIPTEEQMRALLKGTEYGEQ